MTRIGEALRAYLKDRGWLAEDPWSPVFLSWKTVVGEQVSGHSRPIEAEKGVLLIEVDHPGWLQMFTLKKAGILDSIRRAVPGAGVLDVRFRLSRGGGEAPGQ